MLFFSTLKKYKPAPFTWMNVMSSALACAEPRCQYAQVGYSCIYIKVLDCELIFLFLIIVAQIHPTEIMFNPRLTY